MAKVTIQKNNFSAGELSDELYSRTDIAQYANSARELFNVLPVIEGGVKRRPGTKVVSFIVVGGSARLIPFVVDQTNAFQLLLGSGILNIYARDGSLKALFISPWLAAELPEISVVQQRNKMWIASGGRPLYWLRCNDTFTAWVLEEFVLDVPPFDEVNPTPELGLQPDKKEPVGDTVTLTMEAPGAFTAGDVGRYVKINGGVIKITGFTSATVVTGIIMQALNATVIAIAKSWTLCQSIWTVGLGYPRALTYYKQRLVCAGTHTYPNMIWFSRIADERNFELTTLDSDAIAVAASSDQVNPILHLAQSRGVVALTSGSEFLLSSGDSPLTPTTIQATEYTAHGASGSARPVRVGNEMLFIQRGGQRVRALSFRYEVDGLVSPDISALVTHIARNHGGIREMTYQQEPDSIVWVVLGDGNVASITLDRDQEVVAWARHDFGGSVLSMSTLPSVLGADEVWLLVNHGGSLILEKLDPDCRVDAGISGTAAGDKLPTGGGSTHLTGKQVAAYWGNRVIDVDHTTNDDVFFVPDVVADGALVTAGLPFTSRVRPFPPELSQAPSTAMQARAKLDSITFVLKDTLGIEFRGDPLSLQTHDDLLIDVDPALFTGRHTVETTGWEDLNEMNLVIEQNQPLPMRLQAVIYSISANEK